LHDTAAVQFEAHVGGTRLTGSGHRRDAVAKRQSAESQALRLDGERAFLVSLLLVELRLQIVEEELPPHAVTVPAHPAQARSCPQVEEMLDTQSEAPLRFTQGSS
jgi:hypothetical protein